MDRLLLVYRGAPDGSAESRQHDLQRWASWFDSLGDRLLDRGGLSHASVDMDTRVAGPKSSSSSLTWLLGRGSLRFQRSCRVG